jgi:hypothetical protein
MLQTSLRNLDGCAINGLQGTSFAAPIATGIIALALEAKYVFCFLKFVILVLIYILELLNLLLCWNSTHQLNIYKPEQ